jgi:general secretion pathway protein D
MIKKKFGMLAVLFIALAAASLEPLPAQDMKSLEFKDQEIRDILFVLARLNDLSIVPDDTVNGRASFYFSSMDYDEALRLFLDSNGLYCSKRDGIYNVSRILARQDLESGFLTVKCVDVQLRSLVLALSIAACTTILFDQLPSDTIALQVAGASLKDILAMIAAKYRDYVVDGKDGYFYIRKKDQFGQALDSAGRGLFTAEDGLYSIAAERARFRDLAVDLFAKAGKEVVFLMDQDLVMEDLNYRDKGFEEMLRLLLVKAGGDFAVSDGVYFIMEVQKRDLQSKFLTTLIVPLRYISMQDFLRLVPPSLGSGGKIKADDRDNKLILNGTLEELSPILDFAALVDTPKSNGSTVRFDLSYLRSDEAIPLLPAEFSAFGPVPLPAKTGFMVTLPAAQAEKLRGIVAMIDRADPAVPITLDYIRADELLAALPPSASEQTVKKTTDPRMIFFKGTEAQRRAFLRDLAAIDHPKAQIKYQVLVLALTDNESDDWRAGLSAVDSGGAPGLSLTMGEFKDLLSIGFDVISTFGLDFGLSLQWKIARNKAQVLADTTLTALSGERIAFKNTQTIRVKDTEETGTSGEATAQIIREISSGLILNIEGWVSGGRMITMRIDTTLSEAMQSDAKDALPKTAEKVMSTTARTEIGKPIMVTGLKQRLLTRDVKKVPILGEIPLLGPLFRSRNENASTVDYVISIVPRLELPEMARDRLEREIVEGYYRYLFARDATGRG